MKNKFESVSNTGDDLLQAICKCKRSGEVHATSPKCTGRNCSHFIWHTNQRFCTILCPATKGVAEVFSVDLTFKLGGFYKTVTSFRNPMLINKERTHPTHIGPVQIQHRKLVPSYRFFLSSLKRIESSIIDLKTFGTDKESNLGVILDQNWVRLSDAALDYFFLSNICFIKNRVNMLWT